MTSHIGGASTDWNDAMEAAARECEKAAQEIAEMPSLKTSEYLQGCHAEALSRAIAIRELKR